MSLVPRLLLLLSPEERLFEFPAGSRLFRQHLRRHANTAHPRRFPPTLPPVNLGQIAGAHDVEQGIPVLATASFRTPSNQPSNSSIGGRTCPSRSAVK